MDGGDASSQGDRREDGEGVGNAKRPLLVAESLGCVIADDVASGGRGGEGEVGREGLKDLTGERFEESEEGSLFLDEDDEKEIETLVGLVIEKARRDLIVESMRNDFASQADDSSASAMPSQGDPDDISQSPPRYTSRTDEAVSSSVTEGLSSREKPVTGIHEKDTDPPGEVERELDALIRFVIEKSENDIMRARRGQADAVCLEGEASVEDETLLGDDATVGDLLNPDGKNETGLNFGFHDVIRRLTACESDEDDWEDGNEIFCETKRDEGLVKAESGLELTSEAQSAEVLQEVQGEVRGYTTDEEGRQSRQEVNESKTYRYSLSDEAKSVQQEMQREVEEGRNEEAIETSHPLEQEVSSEALGEVTQQEMHRVVVEGGGNEEVFGTTDPSEAVGEAEEIENDNRREQSSRGEEYYDDLSSGEDEEVESMVGFVINAARSSLQGNFDVFTFNKSIDNNENRGRADEDKQAEDICSSTRAPKSQMQTLLDVVEDDSSDGKLPPTPNQPIGNIDTSGDHLQHVGQSLTETPVDEQNGGPIEDSISQEKATNQPTEEEPKGFSNLHSWKRATDQNEETKGEERHADGFLEQDDQSSSGKTGKGGETPKEEGRQIAGGIDVQSTDEGGLDTQTQQQNADATRSHQAGDEGIPDDSSSVAQNQPICVLPAKDPTLPAQPADGSSIQEPTSRRSDAATISFIAPHAPLTITDFASDSDDDDDDVFEKEPRPASHGGRLSREPDWECLAIRQISKSQNVYGEPFHSWHPAYHTRHLGATDVLRKFRGADAKQKVGDNSEVVGQSSKGTVSEECPPPQPGELSAGDAASKVLPAPTAGSPSTSLTVVESLHAPAEAEAGVALVNDSLRKKIVLLEERLRQLALELTFLGDRNWRLEAYIDCLIKTLEEMKVTDVVDLDQKTLPLCLFKVKVKAGYKLGSYNGIPSRSLWSYARDGLQAPFVDLSGWGDIDKPVKRPDPGDHTPLPSCGDDVGLSVTQMYQYEAQLEELAIQNQILEAQLREANERAEAMVGANDGADESQCSFAVTEEQQIDQGVQTLERDTLPPDLKVLHEQLQQMQEHQEEGEEIWQQQQQQEQQQQHLQPELQQQNQSIFTSDLQMQTSEQPQQCYVLQDGKQCSLPGVPLQTPLIQNQPPQKQQHQQQQQQQQLLQHQQEQLQQPYQFQTQQQQEHQEQLQPQQAWDPLSVVQGEAVVLPSPGHFDCAEQFSLQDPLEWPTLTESKAELEAHPPPQMSSADPAAFDSQPPWLFPPPFATEPVSYSSQPTGEPAPDKPTLYSPLTVPASTGSIPNEENRHRAPDSYTSDRTRSSVSCQSLRQGRRFESEPSRGTTALQFSPLAHSRSGVDHVSTAQFQTLDLEDQKKTYQSWDAPPVMDNLSLSALGERPSLNGQSWHRDGPGHRAPPSHQRGNPDRNRRFFGGDSVLDAYLLPDFEDAEHDPFFCQDFAPSLSVSEQSFLLGGFSDCNMFAGHPPGDNRGFVGGGSSSSSFGRVPAPYSRPPEQRPAAYAGRQSKPWRRGNLPRHSSYTSSQRSRATTGLTTGEFK